MRKSGLAALVAVLALVASPLEGRKPNVILLFSDDLGYGDTGFNGHPTTATPNLDKLAHGGRVMTSWYSGCPVCSGSRAAIMTGRQFNRIGVPGVLGPGTNIGLPKNETTIASLLKTQSYRTGCVGKWHLGQRKVYLPLSHGFDEYLGIPYSDDMGLALPQKCASSTLPGLESSTSTHEWCENDCMADPGTLYLPLVQQTSRNASVQGQSDTRVVEQPLDLTTLAQKYTKWTEEFISSSVAQGQPFFLYAAFSHVHTTAGNQPDRQYAGCQWKNSTARGAFGDALAELDAQVGAMVAVLERLHIMENTLIIFSSDNGPWMAQGKSGGSTGLFYGRSAGYWNVGKGSTWEGGIREPAFLHWRGVIPPAQRSSAVVSSLDVLPSIARLVGADLPKDRVIDGVDALPIFNDTAHSHRPVLFFYGGASCVKGAPSAARMGPFKAHWATGPGLGGCVGCKQRCFPVGSPLLFNVEEDPSEAYPLNPDKLGQVVLRFQKAYEEETRTFVWGHITPEPDQQGEGPGKYGICCDRSLGCRCNKTTSVGSATPLQTMY